MKAETSPSRKVYMQYTHFFHLLHIDTYLLSETSSRHKDGILRLPKLPIRFPLKERDWRFCSAEALTASGRSENLLWLRSNTLRLLVLAKRPGGKSSSKFLSRPRCEREAELANIWADNRVIALSDNTSV